MLLSQSAPQSRTAKVDGQSTPRVFTPKDIVSPAVFMDYTQSLHFFVRPMDLPAKLLCQLHRGGALIAAAHDKLMADLSTAMQNLNFGQANGSQKHRYSRSFSFAQDLRHLGFA
ncbi:hypothetical protein N7481_001426 [Penicillium waksmanii]|uniref:uncharacterized protein n=1 Tax=Penicillium waksmanii TaxID=69791 RepID=UPI0025472F97|nr:uncharacterized protein N7481_001426 [Penicillium waksmanii]KAJ6001017.1 hypothetical protein N7481_001426 [Penicillium waksmanii]